MFTKIIKKMSLVFLFSLFVSVSFAQISFEPEFGDKRFAPAETYHAKCLSTMYLGFDMKKVDEVEKVHLVLDYDEDSLQIIQLKGEYQGTYTVGSDKLTLDFDRNLDKEVDKTINTNPDNSPFAHIEFKSKKGIGSGQFTVNKESYYITSKGEKVFLEGEYAFDFAEVPECEPDIIAPSISLLYPEDGATGQALDTYFVFEVKDGGKGIDKKSFSLELNDVLYKINNTGTDVNANYNSDSMFRRSGSYLFFFPGYWLAVDKQIDLKARVADLQDYGGPNWVEKDFSISTATGVLLNSEMNPNMMRLFKEKAEQLTASSSECASLNQIYAESTIYNKYKLKSIMAKLACEIKPGTSVDFHLDDAKVSESSGAVASSSSGNLRKKNGFSVFAILGRLLFVITLFLKFHYIQASHKYKKYYNKNNKNKNKNNNKNNKSDEHKSNDDKHVIHIRKNAADTHTPNTTHHTDVDF